MPAFFLTVASPCRVEADILETEVHLELCRGFRGQTEVLCCHEDTKIQAFE